MSIGKYLLALAWFSTEAALATPVPGPPPVEITLAAKEAEIELARGTSLYLVVDGYREVVSVRARGFELEALPLEGYLTAAGRRTDGTEPPVDLVSPALFRVESRPPHGGRPLVAPQRLTPVGAEPDPGPAPTGKPESEVVPPTRYGLALEDGWRLEVTDAVEAAPLPDRLAAAARETWARLRGRSRPEPPRLVLVLAPDGARKLHHLFRIGTPILAILPPTDPS